MQASEDSKMHQPSAAQENPKDCLTCRLVGSATFLSVGGYALWQSRGAAPGTRAQKLFLSVMGVGQDPILPSARSHKFTWFFT